MTKNQSTYVDGLLHGTQIGILASTIYVGISDNIIPWNAVLASSALIVILAIVYRRKA